MADEFLTCSICGRYEECEYINDKPICPDCAYEQECNKNNDDIDELYPGFRNALL